MKLNTNTNTYIIGYAIVLVVIVAFLLAYVSSSLHDRQEQNVLNDKKSQILTSLRITTDDVEATYAEMVRDSLICANNNSADSLQLYVATVDGDTKYVIPVYGMGLWGPIWGYIALDSDRQTVYGAYFDHQGETAGLGAEIKDDKQWQAQFQGKTITDGSAITLGVKKSSDKPDPRCEVDAVTGATLTCNGVDMMLKESLQQYFDFINE